MIVTWEEKDIKPGIRVRTRKDGEEFILGYDGRICPPNRTLSSLSDGAIIFYQLSQVELAKKLTDGLYLPSICFGSMR